MSDEQQEPAGEPKEPKERTWPYVMKLRIPVEYGKLTVTELKFKRGTLGDMKESRLGGGSVPMEQIIKVAARLCNETTKLIEMLDPDDAAEVIELTLDFFARCLPTGLTQ